MSQLKKIQQNGYSLMVDNRAIGNMRAANGYGVAGIKHTYNAPKDFVPGPSHNSARGYSKGSEIITDDGKIFKCIDGLKGRWIRLTGIEVSGDTAPAKPKKTEPAPAPAPEPEEEIVTTQEEPEKEPKPKEKEPEPAIDEIRIPEDIPFHGYITKANDIHTIEELKKAGSGKKGFLALKYFNKDRAKTLQEWIEKNYS